MPIIRSAKKRMRQERKRSAINRSKKETLKTLIKKARADKATKNLTAVFSALDKAAKTHLIHPNKASRLKSRLSKGISTPVTTHPSSGGKQTKTTKIRLKKARKA